MRDFTVYAPCDIDLDVIWRVKNLFETEAALALHDRRTMTLVSESDDEDGLVRRRVTECNLNYNPVPTLFQRMVTKESLRTRVESEWYIAHHDAKHPSIIKISLPFYDGQFPYSVDAWQWLDSGGTEGVCNRIVTRVSIDIQAAGPVSAVAERILEKDMRKGLYKFPGALLKYCKTHGIDTHPARVNSPAPSIHTDAPASTHVTVPLCMDQDGAEASPRVSCVCYGFPALSRRLRRRLRLRRVARDPPPPLEEEDASCRCSVRGCGGCFFWQDAPLPREAPGRYCNNE